MPECGQGAGGSGRVQRELGGDRVGEGSRPGHGGKGSHSLWAIPSVSQSQPWSRAKCILSSNYLSQPQRCHDLFPEFY